MNVMKYFFELFELFTVSPDEELEYADSGFEKVGGGSSAERPGKIL